MVPTVSATGVVSFSKFVYSFDQDYRILDFSAASYLQIAAAAFTIILVAF